MDKFSLKIHLKFSPPRLEFYFNVRTSFQLIPPCVLCVSINCVLFILYRNTFGNYSSSVILIAIW